MTGERPITREAYLDRDEIYCELLVLRCRRGDSRAFRELVGIFERRLLYYLRRLTGNEQEAWDLLQQTWLKVLRRIGSIREPRRLKPWLYTVARNTAADRVRRMQREESCLEEYGAGEAEDESPDDGFFENAELVHYGLGRLPLAQCEILTLYFLEEFSVAEIGDILGLPDGTVKSRLHRARNALRLVLEREGGQR